SAEPMIRVGAEIIDSDRSAPVGPAVGAPGEHYIQGIGTARRRAKRIDVSSGLIGRTVHDNPRLAEQSGRINAPKGLGSAEVYGNRQVKRRRGGRVRDVQGAAHPELRAVPTDHIDFPVGSDVDSAKNSRVRNRNGCHPACAAIGRACEHEIGTVAKTVGSLPVLIDVAPSWAGGCINDHPFLVPALRVAYPLPGYSAVGRTEQVAVEGVGVGDSQVIENAVRVRGQDRVAAESPGIQLAWESPAQPPVGGIGPAGLPEVAVGAVELPPADGNVAWVIGINTYRGFVRRVAHNVLPRRVHINLKAGAKWR